MAIGSGPNLVLGRWAGCVALSVLVASVPLGGLITNPLARAGVLWPIYYAFALLALALLWRSGVWRCVEALLFFTFWAVLASWAGFALRITPDPRLGELEVRALTACAIVSIAVVLGSRGDRAGVWALRAGWLIGMGATCGIGVWEILTGHHLWITTARPWPFGPGTVPAATFINPNNFSVALVGMLVAALAALASVTSRSYASRPLRALFGALAALAVVMIAFTESRAGMLGVVIVLSLEARRRLITAAAGRPLSHVFRERCSGRWVWVIGSVAALVAVLVAGFTVPALAARNPLQTLISDAFREETARSDSLRIDLLAVAWGYLRDSNWVGTGAGSFEPILWNDPTSGIDVDTNLHNAFVELLSQYGVVVFAPLAMVLVTLVWAGARRTPARPVAANRHGDNDSSAIPDLDVGGIARTELLGYLAAYVLLGITASSALALQLWWLMLASSIVGAWHLRVLAGDRCRGEEAAQRFC